MGEDPSGLRWVLTARALHEVAGDPDARSVFAAGSVSVIVPRGRATPQVDGLELVPTASFASVGAMEAAAGAGDLAGDLGALLYDPEHWDFTPPEEQRDVPAHVRRAALLAGSLGLTSIAAPAVTLTRVLARRPIRDRYRAYLDLGIAAAAAAADVVVVQAQNAVRDTEGYRRVVAEAAAQVRAVEPATTVLAGLSTNPPGAAVDAPMLARAISATLGTVAGYWLNVPSPGPHCPTCNPPRPEVGIAALRDAFA